MRQSSAYTETVGDRPPEERAFTGDQWMIAEAVELLRHTSKIQLQDQEVISIWFICFINF